MKNLIIINLFLTTAIVWANPGTIGDLHAVPGDSGLYRRNIDTVDVNLNINGTHVWDFTDNAVTWPEIDEKSYTKNRSEGMFGYLFPEAALVSQIFSVLDTMESYFNKTNQGFFAYGFTVVVLGQTSASIITEGGPARLMLFPITLGDTWLDYYVMTSGIASIHTLNFVEVVDTGQILTELANFPCVVVRMYQDIDVKVFGITVKRMHIYRYDWYVDSLTSVATIQSRDDETNPIFTEAVHVSRLKKLSYYSSVSIKENPANLSEYFSIRAVDNGLKVKLNLIEPGEIKLKLYDISGRLMNAKQLFFNNGGQKEIYWNMDLTKGAFFLKFENGTAVITKKVLIFQ